MNRLLAFAFIAVFTSAQGQVSLKDEWPSMALMFVGGMGNGAAELTKWHYDAFEAVFPNANAEYFDPQVSWRNKYQNGDPAQGPKYFGSTTFLVGTTDFYHAARTVSNTSMILAAVFSPRDNLNWKTILLKFALYSVSYHAGFWVAYELPVRLKK